MNAEGCKFHTLASDSARAENWPGESLVPDVYVKTLQRAAEIEGGEQGLALRLKVTPSHLALWIQGIERPPVEVFLRAVDLVTDQQFPRPDSKTAAPRSGPEL
jgi:hypothetical protein